MRRIGSIFAALGLLLTAACHKPELISSEQLSRPHVVSIIETNPRVIMDPGRPAANISTGPMVGAPLAVVAAGAFVAGAMQEGERSRADVRRRRADLLDDQLGPTGEVGLDLQREFRNALTSEIARGTRMPIQRVETNPASRLGQAPPGGEIMLFLQFSTLMTQDGRMVTLQVLVQQMGWKPENERRPRESPLAISNQLTLVAFSSPIEAASPEIAMGKWRENSYALLRQETRALIPEIMILLRMVVLDAEPFDFANLRRFRSNLPGFSLVERSLSGTPNHTVFQPHIWGHTVRATPQRAYFVMNTLVDRPWVPADGWSVKPGWAWVSVPVGSL